MKLKYLSSAQLRWKWASCVEKSGRYTLLCCLLPVILATYWGGILHPQTEGLHHKITEMQKQLSIPLPLPEETKNTLTEKLSVTEYQQLRMLFDIFGRYHLQIESGNYNSAKVDNNETSALTLSIPLRGEWSALAQALRDISRALPIDVEKLTISRKQPDEQILTITLQLTLHRGNL